MSKLNWETKNMIVKLAYETECTVKIDYVSFDEEVKKIEITKENGNHCAFENPESIIRIMKYFNKVREEKEDFTFWENASYGFTKENKLFHTVKIAFTKNEYFKVSKETLEESKKWNYGIITDYQKEYGFSTVVEYNHKKVNC